MKAYATIIAYLRRQANNHHYFYDTKKIFRWGIFTAIVLVAMFGLFDRSILPTGSLELSAIRFGIVLPTLLLCFTLSFSEHFISKIQIISLFVVLVGSHGSIAAMHIGHGVADVQLLYFPYLVTFIGIFPVILGLNTFFTVIAGLISLITFNLYFMEETMVSLFHKNLLLIAAVVIGCLLEYLLSRLLKSNELNILKLERQKIQLQKSKDDLSTADNIKNKLLYVISHDIRGPLASIKGIVNLFNAGSISQDEFRQHSLKLNYLLAQTGSMLDNLLYWSLAQSEHNINFVKLNVYELTQHCFDTLRAQAASKAIRLENNFDQDLYMHADANLLRITFFNIISNAIKFTNAGQVTARSLTASGAIHLQFADTGVGMDAKEIESLFNWSRIANTRGTHSERGPGLGLLICKEFIDQHNGSIAVQSQKWKGTTVTISLPLSMIASEPANLGLKGSGRLTTATA